MTKVGIEEAEEGAEGGGGEEEVEGTQVVTDGTSNRVKDQAVCGETEESADHAVDEAPPENHCGHDKDEAEPFSVGAKRIPEIGNHPEDHDCRKRSGKVGNEDDRTGSGLSKLNQEGPQDDYGHHSDRPKENEVFREQPVVRDTAKRDEKNANLDRLSAVLGSYREFVLFKGLVGCLERAAGSRGRRFYLIGHQLWESRENEALGKKGF